MGDIKNAIRFSLLTRYGLTFTSIISTMTFSRILTPAEIGTFAIASATIAISSELRNIGVGSYLIREKDLGQNLVSSALGLAMLISWSLGIVLFSTASLASDFYDLDDLAVLIKILSITFFLSPFINIQSSILTRNFAFKHILYLNLGGGILIFLSSLIMILSGLSYFALAIGMVTGTVFKLVLLQFFSSNYNFWRPSFSRLRPLVKFGIVSSASGMFTKAQDLIPDIVIGKVAGTEQVAIFSKAIGLNTTVSSLTTQAVAPIALPYISSVNRAGASASEAYLNATQLLTVLVWPVILCAGKASYPIVMILFGSQWVNSVYLASVLSIWMFFKSAHAFSEALLLASHKERQLLVLRMICFSVYLSMVVGAATIGWNYVAYALVASSIIEFLLFLFFLHKALNFSIRDYMLSNAKSLVIACFCYSITFGIDQFLNFEDAPLYLSFLVLMTILPIAWVASVFVLNHPIKTYLLGIFEYCISKISFLNKDA